MIKITSVVADITLVTMITSVVMITCVVAKITFKVVVITYFSRQDHFCSGLDHFQSVCDP